VTGSFRRRVASVIAVAVGFGVIITGAPASASSTHLRTDVYQVAPNHTTVAPLSHTDGASDWWW
jgi:hypothetical protein